MACKSDNIYEIGSTKLPDSPRKPLYPMTHTKAVFDDNQVSQDEINKRLWEAIRNQIVTSGSTTISDDGYWIVDGQKTDFRVQGEKGEKGDGVSVSNEFGTDKHISISQDTLSKAFARIYSILEDITGTVYQGVSMSITPGYFIGEDGCTVHIKATTAEANGIFEHIALYFNGTLAAEDSNVDYFERDIEIETTTVIQCVAKIMGMEYSQQKVVTHFNSFWLGGGASYASIMDVNHVIPVTNGMRGAYDVEVPQGGHIIIVVGEGIASGFIRADINSVEIPMTETQVTVNGNAYRVFTSVNTYVAGKYNVDING